MEPRYGILRRMGLCLRCLSWPDEGVMWFTMILGTDVEELLIELDADIADPPPTLDDMTELKESIPRTNQEVSGVPSTTVM